MWVTAGSPNLYSKELFAELRARDLPAILAGLSILTAVAGPFGSHAVLDFWQRIAFWFPVILVASLGFVAFRVLLLQRVAPNRRAAASVLASFLYSIGGAPVLGVLFQRLFNPYFGTFAGWAEIATLGVLLTLGLCFLRHPADIGHLEADDPSAEPAQVEQPSEPSPAPRLSERLAPDQRGAIRFLQVNDHYVVVNTDRGQANLLMRFSDAISETLPLEGAQVHRSFWVAWGAVQRAEQDKGRWFLALAGGARVPVSRANVGKLQARGLI